MEKIKLVADVDIPYISDILNSNMETVVYAKGRDIDPVMLKDADALLIRTRTKCNAGLLEGSRVKFIASATIGEDHVDIPYCTRSGISVYFAKGCNSAGVMQYVYTALSVLYLRFGYDFFGKTIGVVGVGNVGSKVVRMAERLGMRVLMCDPPRERAETGRKNGKKNLFVSLDELLAASDIVTLHVPLTEETERMADNAFFEKMKEGAVLINTSRGEVVDDDALIRHRSRLSRVVLDVWNGEPEIAGSLLRLVDIATPHIAGYSRQGKINGSNMVLNALGRYFRNDVLAAADLYGMIPDSSPVVIPPVEEMTPDGFSRKMVDMFPIMVLDEALRNSAAAFENLRSGYRYRNEFISLPLR